MKPGTAEELEAVIKSHDSWWTTKFPAHAANRLVAILVDTSITPNQVTLVSLFLGLMAAATFGTGKWIWMATGALVLQGSFILDCADGQLARLKGMTSQKGAWLDVTTDVIKDFAVYFGLTLGVVRYNGDQTLWAWGFAAYFLSVAGMFFYYMRPDHLKAETADADEDEKESNSVIEDIYRLIRRRAYFLSFSLPDQLLLISIGALLGLLDLLLHIFVFWGAASISFSVIRTWRRLSE